MIIEGMYDRTIVAIGHWALPLAPCLWYNQSSGKHFRWGYLGAEPRQLAFAFLLHYCGAEDAIEYVTDFHKEVISKLPRKDFILHSEDIINYIKMKKAQKQKIGRIFWKAAVKLRITQLLFSDTFYEALYPDPEDIAWNEWKKQQDILAKKAGKNAKRSKKIVSTPKHSAIPGMVLKPAIS